MPLCVDILKELISIISGRVPVEVEVAIRKLMATYSGNITSILCQFPSQQVRDLLQRLSSIRSSNFTTEV